MIKMDLKHELRPVCQARFTTDGTHFDNIEGQARLDRAFQERVDELEDEQIDTGIHAWDTCKNKGPTGPTG